MRISDWSSDVCSSDLNTQFLVGGTYRRATTVYPGNTADRRGSVHFNLGHQTSGDRFTINFGGIYSYDKNSLITSDLAGQIARPPNLPTPYDEHGKLSWNSKGYSDTSPLAGLNDEYEARTINIMGSMRWN